MCTFAPANEKSFVIHSWCHSSVGRPCDGANGLGVPFKDKFDKTLKLYSLMTTKPEEVEARKQKEMEE